MPIYEYACEQCGHEFEKLVRIGADAPPCPECGAGVRKKVSASGFILKGGGWYKDHYGLKGGGSKSGSSASSDGAGGTASESSSSSSSSSDASSSSSSTSGSSNTTSSS